MRVGADRVAAPLLRRVGADRAAPLLRVGADRAAPLLRVGAERVAPLLRVGADRAAPLLLVGAERVVARLELGRDAPLLRGGAERADAAEPRRGTPLERAALPEEPRVGATEPREGTDRLVAPLLRGAGRRVDADGRDEREGTPALERVEGVLRDGAAPPLREVGGRVVEGVAPRVLGTPLRVLGTLPRVLGTPLRVLGVPRLGAAPPLRVVGRRVEAGVPPRVLDGRVALGVVPRLPVVRAASDGRVRADPAAGGAAPGPVRRVLGDVRSVLGRAGTALPVPVRPVEPRAAAPVDPEGRVRGVAAVPRGAAGEDGPRAPGARARPVADRVDGAGLDETAGAAPRGRAVRPFPPLARAPGDSL